MKDASRIDIDEAIESLPSFDAVLDARSPSEFADDRLPDAISTPVLDDAERERIGILYNQVSPFEARRVGAALVSANIAELLQQRLADRPRDWRPLVYCWRGGNRSSSLATVLARIGWRTSVLEGGYRSYRRRVVQDLARLPASLTLHVVAGRTGSGKSLILDQLSALGAQVLDLETLARHRGSVLGLMPDAVQPSQKRFESLIWECLRRFDPHRPIFVESESKRVGRCQVPDALIARMRDARCTLIESPLAQRAALLLREYRHFTEDSATLFAQLEHLVALHGRRRVDDWRTLAQAGQWETFVATLLEAHYDPAYDRSMARNYGALARAAHLEPAAGDEAAHRAVALALIESAGDRAASETAAANAR